VTVCAHNRGCVFGEIVNDASRMVHAAWEDLSRHYAGIELDAFVVMPEPRAWDHRYRRGGFETRPYKCK
jgi:hypothetical protein